MSAHAFQDPAPQDSGQPAVEACAVRFLLDADPSPGLLPRLMQPFARLDLVPDRMWSDRQGETMHVEIAMNAMPAESARLVEGNLRMVIGVRSVVRIGRTDRRQAA